MTIRKIAPLCALAVGLLALPGVGLAGEVTKDAKDAPKVEEPPQRLISGDFGTGFVSQYISRGLVLNNQDAINQTYADLYVALYQNDKTFLNKVQLNLGIWFDFDPHSTQAGTAGGGISSNVTVPYWYEFDFTPGLTFTFGKYFTFSPSYYVFTSPNSSFTTFQGLNLNFGFDDSKFLGAFALHPSFTYLRELHNKAGNGSDQGNYFEIGITPAVPVGPATISFPVTAGFGTDNFYGNNDGFGYVTPGVQFGIPLKFIPAAYGTWNFTSYYKFYYLGDSLSDFNTANPTPGIEDNSVRHATHYEHVFSGGITVAF